MQEDKSIDISDNTKLIDRIRFLYLDEPRSVRRAEEVIRNSLKADTRYWSTLTDNIRVGSTKLKPDKYKLEIYSIKNNIKTKVHSQIINIEDKQNIIDINL